MNVKSALVKEAYFFDSYLSSPFFDDSAAR